MHYSTQNAILTSFRCENMAMGMPHFHSENLAEFRIWCTMVYQQGFVLVYTTRANMLVLGRARAPRNIMHIDTCRIHGETDVTWWHGSRRSHHDDYAHKMTWICTYSNRFKQILMPQGQEHLWSERVTLVAMRGHHTKCTITHTYVGI